MKKMVEVGFDASRRLEDQMRLFHLALISSYHHIGDIIDPIQDGSGTIDTSIYAKALKLWPALGRQNQLRMSTRIKTKVATPKCVPMPEMKPRKITATCVSAMLEQVITLLLLSHILGIDLTVTEKGLFQNTRFVRRHRFAAPMRGIILQSWDLTTERISTDCAILPVKLHCPIIIQYTIRYYSLRDAQTRLDTRTIRQPLRCVHTPLLKEWVGNAFPSTHARYYIKRISRAPEFTPLILYGVLGGVEFNSITIMTFEDDAHAMRFQAKYAEPEVNARMMEDENKYMAKKTIKCFGLGDPRITKL
ncbi:uncharacterized protein BDR25DRAFT_362360 [Lindgomyces ingoldianus]|uniref:Uncharacterized protein n=1 Tax=Lindgomyces ingoldianus TaxID=673940 RepID=A0ACB6QCT4_9PLEO|nr:uncharacterized protein BDR25DRAFT_362360 [Lindgomyces ingoldianus]KAF2463927.1 hypothetical protein BDR25DRAFT_362360 [Lindgomyces ingoldianus]